MAASKIMLIRHAEKPSDDGSIKGVAADGEHDDEELIVRGWQRSGALVRFFKPRSGPLSDPHLATPDIVFASVVGRHSESLRPQHTVLALALMLGFQLTATRLKDDIAGLAADAVAANGAVLIAWEHQFIPAIVNLIVGNSTTCPQTWPGTRFDVVWVLDRHGASGPWSFSQVPQLLLAGDSPQPIS
jgi:hypothetical protein